MSAPAKLYRRTDAMIATSDIRIDRQQSVGVVSLVQRKQTRKYNTKREKIKRIITKQQHSA